MAIFYSTMYKRALVNHFNPKEHIPWNLKHNKFYPICVSVCTIFHTQKNMSIHKYNTKHWSPGHGMRNLRNFIFHVNWLHLYLTYHYTKSWLIFHTIILIINQKFLQATEICNHDDDELVGWLSEHKFFKDQVTNPIKAKSAAKHWYTGIWLVRFYYAEGFNPWW
jgi:hypothetical protein